MKIICVVGNYGEEGPLSWYTLPDSSVIRSGKPFFLPEPETGHKASVSLAVRIDRLGKSIRRKFAPRYYSEITVGVNVVNVSLLERLRARLLPWGPAVAFDGSLWLGDFIPVVRPISEVEIEVMRGEESVTCLRPADLTNDIDSLIEILSDRVTLKTGDIILCGLSPDGFVPALKDDIICRLDGQELLKIKVR